MGPSFTTLDRDNGLLRYDLEEAASNLFAMLRALDRPAYRAIAVMPIPARGLGEAIRDRLMRAAAPRTKGERTK